MTDKADANQQRNPADSEIGPVRADEQKIVSPAPASDAAATAAPIALPAHAAATDTQALYRTVFEIVKSFATTTTRSGKWDFLPRPVGLYRIDKSKEFAVVLKQNLTVEQLITIGVYARNQGELRHAKWLNGSSPVYVVVNESDFTFTCSRGNATLRSYTGTVLELAVQREPEKLQQSPKSLFVVASQDDVEVMHQLALPAVTSDGLETLSHDGLTRLFAGEPERDRQWRYHLVLMDLEISLLQNRTTASIGKAINRLADAAVIYGIDPARRFSVCRPCDREFAILEIAMTFADCAPIRQIVEKWASAAQLECDKGWRTRFSADTLTFRAARSALERALQLSNEISRRHAVADALPDYRAICHRAIVQKFYFDIDRATDPFDKLDLIAAVDSAEAFLDCDARVRAAETVLAGRAPPPLRDFRDALFDQRERYFVELKRIHRDRQPKR